MTSGHHDDGADDGPAVVSDGTENRFSGQQPPRLVPQERQKFIAGRKRSIDHASVLARRFCFLDVVSSGKIAARNLC